jgi:hypothetical protein
MVKKRKNKYGFRPSSTGDNQSCKLIWVSFQRPKQERTWPRQAYSLLKLLAMHAQGQGNQTIHDSQHGRVRGYSYAPNFEPCSTSHNFRACRN